MFFLNLLDKLTGKQYIGSAYGHEGIWGRWTEYMNTNGTGNNKQLEELIIKFIGFKIIIQEQIKIVSFNQSRIIVL